jgi:hypothetical protein
MAFLAWIVVGLIAVSLPAIIVAFIGAVDFGREHSLN